jgi:hypothetical protein
MAKSQQSAGAVPTFGALIAAVALTTNPASTRADELSDLRANQQLLQQRIDQLATAVSNKSEQQAAVTAGPVVAGAPSIAGSFPRSFLIPGTNTSIAISGYVKFNAAEWITGGSPALGSGLSPPVTGNAIISGVPLNLKGPAGSITAPPAFNPAKRQHFVFHDSAAESRLRIETRTPTDIGQVTTVLEFDFQGCGADSGICSNLDNGTFPSLARLRLAYGTVGGLFAGQSFSPVDDLAAHGEFIDFGGDAGQFGFSRAPWIGYTWQLPYGLSFLAAAVTPATSVWTPLGGLDTGCNPATGLTGVSNCPAGSPGGFAVNPTKTNLPDANFVLKATQPWGHVQASLVVQRLTLQDGRFLNQNFVGYGGDLSGNIKPNWFGFSSKDNLGWEFWAGDGLGRYAAPPGGAEPTTSNALQSNFGLVGISCLPSTGVGCYGNAAAGPTGNTATNAALVRTSTVTAYGGQANYQHWWRPNLRSTVSGGVQTNVFDSSILPFNTVTLNFNKTLVTAHANIIWSPVSFIDTGFEYVFGQRLTYLHQRG